ALVWWGGAALVGGWAGHLAGAGLGVAALAGVMQGLRKLDTKLFAYYMLYDFAQVAQHRGAFGAELQARLDSFADEVAAALVGRRGLPETGARLALLTLGQAIPMQAFLPEARQLRADLRQLAASPSVTWIDVTARGDGVCFWLTDPPAVCGVAPEDQTRPLVF